MRLHPSRWPERFSAFSRVSHAERSNLSPKPDLSRLAMRRSPLAAGSATPGLDEPCGPTNHGAKYEAVKRGDNRPESAEKRPARVSATDRGGSNDAPAARSALHAMRAPRGG